MRRGGTGGVHVEMVNTSDRSLLRAVRGAAEGEQISARGAPRAALERDALRAKRGRAGPTLHPRVAVPTSAHARERARSFGVRAGGTEVVGLRTQAGAIGRSRR